MQKQILTAILLLLLSFTAVHAQNFSTHQVKEGETIEAIARRYFVTPTDIYSLNPDAKKELKPNTILIIPISKAKKPEITEVKELRGFKKHKAKRKETLYAISKEYGVEIEDIKKHNTFLYANNLRKGDKLQIPVYKITKVENEDEPYKPYIVQPKEGKWRIAYKFGISVGELEEINPKMGQVLQEGQQIYVPNIKKTEELVIDEKYSYYKVLPKEGFYRLKIKLGLEQETLEKLNPGLSETGLKDGMILKIPFNGTKGMDMGTMAPTNLTKAITDFSQKHLVLMLPFRLNKVEFDSVADTKRSIEKDPYLDASLDFYSGAIVALDSLKTLGVSVKLDVYDTKYQTSTVTQLLQDKTFEDVDAVIGPLTNNTFDIVSKALNQYNIPVVSPIGVNLKLYDNVFQSRPSDEMLRDKMIQYIKRDSLPKNIIVIADSNNSETANMLKQEFVASTIVFSRKNKKTGKDEHFVTRDDIQSALKPGRNIVFIETQNEGFVSNVTSILASSTQFGNKEQGRDSTTITLVTSKFNSAFEGDEINNAHLSKLHFTYATSSKKYSDDNHNSFVKRYVDTFKTTPNNRAVKGFDLMMDVVLRLVTSSDFFLSVNTAPLTAYVENKFAYKKNVLAGYYNEAVYLVKYDNLNIVEVKY